MSTSEIQEKSDWEGLYKPLLKILARHGVNDPFGDGDLFLVDDDYGEKQHKVECSSGSFVTSELMFATQGLIVSYPEGWEVIWALPSNAGRHHAFVIDRNGYAEHSA